MSLITHCGGGQVDRQELARIEPPDSTETWFPLKHSTVLDTVESSLSQAGFGIADMRLATAQDGLEFFATIQLNTLLGDSEALTVGVRNSNNKRFPLGFCVGRRTFVCDNLAFSSDIVISKKHTRFGEERYTEGIHHAVAQLGQYQEVETRRIEALQATPVTPVEADALILRAAEKGVIGWRQAPKVLEEWRNPQFEEHTDDNRYCLLQAFTAVLRNRFDKYPLKAAYESIQIQQFLFA